MYSHSQEQLGIKGPDIILPSTFEIDQVIAFSGVYFLT